MLMQLEWCISPFILAIPSHKTLFPQSSVTYTVPIAYINISLSQQQFCKQVPLITCCPPARLWAPPMLNATCYASLSLLSALPMDWRHHCDSRKCFLFCSLLYPFCLKCCLAHSSYWRNNCSFDRSVRKSVCCLHNEFTRPYKASTFTECRAN